MEDNEGFRGLDEVIKFKTVEKTVRLNTKNKLYAGRTNNKFTKTIMSG